MDPKLQQALVATRAGQTQKAQQLLGQLIQENPDNPDAWFLLGHLVDSDERATLYLNRVLEIDPDYAPASARLTTLTAVPVVAGVEETAVEAVASEDVPAWLQEESAAISEDVVVATVDDETGLPDWLRDLEDAETTPEAPAAEPLAAAAASAAATSAVAAPASPPARPAAPPAKKAQSAPAPARKSSAKPAGKRKSDAWLTGILIFLILIAIVVMGALVYLVFAG